MPALCVCVYIVVSSYDLYDDIRLCNSKVDMNLFFDPKEENTHWSLIGRTVQNRAEKININPYKKNTLHVHVHVHW